ncbi:hypothetical protein [Nioella nitratireducens]|uniref:hypothetical protein n=1 Tax=Nioella nitratireducens TaxID=1287720 RepID=UPI0008FD4DD7|nr:hypothetical protein [Nioella nitratireducens]
MSSNRWFSGQTQVFWTCKALLDGRTISHKTEIREVRGWRLGAIVHRLKHEYGWPIHAEYRGPQNIAHYCLAETADRAALRLPPSAKALAADGGDA